MKNSVKYYVFLFFISLLFIPCVLAKDVNHFYSEASDNIAFSDVINGSSFIAGNEVEINGKVNGAGFFAGNSIDYSGQSDYLIIAGNDIDIDGSVLHDVVIAGNDIEISSNSILNRDVIIAGNNIEISGKIVRNVSVFGSNVVFKGAKIDGNVKIYCEDVSVDDNTIILGSFSYPEDANAKISANISNISKSPAISVKENILSVLMGKVLSFMSLVFIFAIMTVFMPKLFASVQSKYDKVEFNLVTETFSKGLIFLIVVPIISIFLLMIPFGIPLSLILIAFYIIISYLSKIFTSYFIGFKLWQKSSMTYINILLVGILGFALLFVLDLIPGINILASLVSLIFGIGIIINLYSKN